MATTASPPGNGREGWTRERVEQRLIEAFRRLPGTAIYSPRVGVLHAAGIGPAPSELDIISHSAWVLGARSDERLFLFVWAKAQAGLEPSVSTFCRERALSRSTFDRAVDRAVEKIVHSLA